ncbi:aldehyde dehydrogenase (NADP(+)) [Chitinophagaceae bacterium LB-8]|uniref:Aldehyde dehydrogenase (NADP(+)) n=1 Tax=Paraflavisolibacter caeni TaxID=2982496 RepID=A0A9X2XWV7_9BACT|nr:aldehyde dehydrogenase (NADP(+)) [Paraflavisolibacter caeni]MCU7550167.1 aldehyde dehydrogenase (NADP(+)) [Paraflavisolibacter caeni]
MELTGKNMIGNKLSNESNATFFCENPATGKKLEPAFYEASPNEINEAIEKANHAFQQYRNKTGKEKAEFLEAIADEILALNDQLIVRAMEESGLPEARLTGERGRTVGQLKLFAQLLREGSWVDARIDTADPDRKPLPKPDIRSMQKALGPVGVFGASNFPLAFSVAGGDTVAALAAGCTVIFKAHPAHPGTSELVGLAIQNAVRKTGMPEGTFSMVQGRSTDVGMTIVRHPLIKAIGFTGSYYGGKALFDEANKRPSPIPVYAEMGSTNPVFILPRILNEKGEKIAQELAASVTLGVGQFCTNPGLVFIGQTENESKFIDQLSRQVNEINAGVMLTSGIQNNYQKGIEKLSSIDGVSILAKGKSDGEGVRGTPHVLHATAALFQQRHELEEEVFGPSTLTVTADSKEELLQVAKQLSGHLTATIQGTEEDLNEYAELVTILEQKVGRVLINGYPTGVEVCHAMVHGGPFPATTDSRTTSVGTLAIHRFTRPVCYQDFPQSLLPAELKDDNSLSIWRLVNGERKK